MKKNKVKVNIAEWGSYDLEGDLTAAIEELQKLISDSPDCFDFKIDVNTETGYYGDCSTAISIYAYRWETDTEYNNRVEAEKNMKKAQKQKAIKDAEAQEKRERSLYETLKKKFETQSK